MSVEIVPIDEDNLDELGFFCKKSKRRSPGWRAKRSWLDDAGAATRLWLALDGKRQVGFVEAAPAHAAWRAVDAPGHLVVHCLWVVGRAKEQGTGARLLKAVLAAADAEGLGVASLTSTMKGWLHGSGVVRSAGFERVAVGPPCFELWARTPPGQPTPTLPTDWEARAAAFGDGLTLVATAQCPYVDAVEEAYARAAERHGLDFRTVRLASAEEVRARSPSPYGVFAVVRDGKLVTWRYEADTVIDRLLGT